MSNQSGKTVEPVPAWARGVWRRNSMRDASGLVDHTTQVYWAQTPTLFADVRIPADRPDKAGQTSLADYDDDELLQLARQQGFAGSLPIDGQIFRWRRDIDYQPLQPWLDEAAMFREGDKLIEIGIHDNYFEDYTLVDDGDGQFLAFDCPTHRRLLVVVGRRFLFVRDREMALPDSAELADLVAQAEPEKKRALLDCEFSLGHGRNGDDLWQIDLSTLPFREGQSLFASSSWQFDLENQRAVETTDAVTREWTVHSCMLDQRALARRFPS